MTELEEKIYKNGSFIMSYTLTKGITPINALVLSRFMVERNYAVKNHFITDDGFFICDVKELSYHTGLSEDVICNVTINLIRRNIIQGKKIDETCLIRIDDEKIIEIVNELENEESKDYSNWDKGLEKIQKNIFKLTHKKGKLK